MIGGKELLRRASINTGIAVAFAILLLAVYPRLPLHRLWIRFFYSLVYAHSIGWLAFAAIPRVWSAAKNLALGVQWAIRVATVFLITIVGSMLAALIMVALRQLPLSGYWAELAFNLKIALVVTAFASAIIATYESQRSRLRRGELERERALKLATQAQLASLESRIHPHFLFNALNAISALIPEDPQRAERLVEQVAALLRFSLDSNQSGLVPLAAELKIVADYLEIERARFGERLRYRIDVDDTLKNTRVPPLSVQTLVENSVKHAVAPNRAGGEIRISAAWDNGALRLGVSDNGPAFQLESAPAGHGLDNLKGRLAALFSDAAALTVERLDNGNLVRLSIPQTGNEHARIPA